MRNKEEKKKEELQKEKYEKPKIEGELDAYIYNIHNVELFKNCEEKMNQRTLQKFNQKLIEKTVRDYLWPKVKFMVENFKDNTKQQTMDLVRNYAYGLSNKDLLHLTKEMAY